MSLWSVRVDGLSMGIYDPVVEAKSSSAARYAAFKAARDAGYFAGRDGFWRFVISSSVRKADMMERIHAPRIGGAK